MELLNRVMLIGRLTKDSEIKKTQSGYTVASFTVATDRRGKEVKTDFINCVAWEKVADIAQRYGKKGLLVYIEGSLEIDSYKSADGANRQVARVNVNRFVALERVEQRAHSGLVPQTGAGESNDGWYSRMQTESMNIDLDNVPF